MRTELEDFVFFTQKRKFGNNMTPEEKFDLMFEVIKDEIKNEYRAHHSKPWIIGFSGGKDSTLMLHLVLEAIFEIPFSQRKREVHIVANDTLVESPIVAHYVNKVLKKIDKSISRLNVPFTVKKTAPDINHTFWVNLIGRGYPPPTKFFRWCTDRMKIKPTTQYIHEKVTEAGEAILLLGVRRKESSERARNAKKYDNGDRLNRHNDIQNCLVFRPILELSTEDVWNYLADNDAPWGGDHNDLKQLYLDASGDECLLVIDPDAAPSCGSTSVRFGCWTCTVVNKDRSFRAAIDQGFPHLVPMVEFRDWIKEFCYRDENRMNTRRNGSFGKGPLKFEIRELVLEKLLQLQSDVNEALISEKEIECIKQIWTDDQAVNILRFTSKLNDMTANGA